MIIETLRARSVFSGIAALDESVFPLDRAALALALEDYPDLDIESHLREIDALAGHVSVLLGQNRTPMNVIEALNEVLFGREGLRGNTEEYYDPRNSFLNEVLRRKTGIPISLSVLYIEVARRIDFPLHGVGLPGHFLVKYIDAEREILIDPFSGGRILSVQNCQELLDRLFGGSVQVQPAHLEAMGKRAIITRMLFNLKGIYYQKEEYAKALAIVERILMLNPDTPSEIRDRGMLFMHSSFFAKALADLLYYAAHAPGADDAAYVENHVRLLRTIVSCPN